MFDPLCRGRRAQTCRGHISAAADEVCLKVGRQAEWGDALDGGRRELQSTIRTCAQERGDAIARQSNRLLHLGQLLPRRSGVRVGLIDRALCSAEMIEFRRMLIGEVGRSDLGKRVHDRGPAVYVKRVAEMIAAQMREGRLRQVDSSQAALHLMSLCMGPPVQWLLEGAIDRPSDQELAAAAAAAADVFLRAYAVEPAVARRSRPAARRRSRQPASGAPGNCP